MKTAKTICFILLMTLATASSWAGQMNHTAIRRQALKAFQDGNWKVSYQLYRQLCLEVANDPEMVPNDLIQAWQCLRRLNRLSELDGFREEVIDKHHDNWRLLRSAADSYSQNTHQGYIVAGKFHRGPHRGGGRFVNSGRRDRVRAMQLMKQALALTSGELSQTDVADFYLDFAGIVIQYGGYDQAWRLQYLTELDRLPDYEPGHVYGYNRNIPGAPVDAQGRPVFHQVPVDFGSAKSDGERWRWLLAKASELNPKLQPLVKFNLASFIHQQFGVQTLSIYAHYLTRSRPEQTADQAKDQFSPYDLHTLSDRETLARLANGVKRFDLPEGYNHIELLKEIVSYPDKSYAERAAALLAGIYENRRQYERAVDYWKIYQQYNPTESRQHIDQIIANQGVFEPSGIEPAGGAPTVEYRYRNGELVNFEAYRIRLDRLLEDVKAYIRSNPSRLDRNKMEINRIGRRLVQENQTKYIGKQVANWDLKLDPDRRHWDRRITVKMPDPLKKAGAYLLLGKMQNGNTARIVIWVSDTAIIKKSLDKRMLYYVTDAVNGNPLADTAIDFFGYRSKKIKGKNRYQILHKQLSRQTDRDGMVVLGQEELDSKFHWLATVRTEERLAFMGFSSVWYPD